MSSFGWAKRSLAILGMLSVASCVPPSGSAVSLAALQAGLAARLWQRSVPSLTAFIDTDEFLSFGGALIRGDAPLTPDNRFFRSLAAGDRAPAADCLTAAVYYEARSEDEAGQRAVAQVVLNRVRHYAFPRTVCRVVFEGSARRTGCQFSFTCDGSMARDLDRRAWERARRIASEALAGYVHAPVGRATHYHTDAVDPYWAPTLQPVTSVGSHLFYRWKGRAGEPEAFSRPSGGRLASGALRRTEPQRLD